MRNTGLVHYLIGGHRTNFSTANKVPESPLKAPFTTQIEEDDTEMVLFKQHYSKVSKYAVCIILCLALPSNIVRLLEFSSNPEVNFVEISFMFIMYWEQFFIASLEIQFTVICYSIYLRFFEINIMLENIYNNFNRPFHEFLVGGVMEYHVLNDIADNLGK